jgi:hypothetical protein
MVKNDIAFLKKHRKTVKNNSPKPPLGLKYRVKAKGFAADGMVHLFPYSFSTNT